MENTKHSLNVAERGSFINLGNQKIQLDVFTAQHAKLASSLLDMFQAENLDLLEFSENSNFAILLVSRLLDMLDNASFKNKAVALLSSLANTDVSNFSQADLHELLLHVVKNNSDFFLKKIQNLATSLASIAKVTMTKEAF